MNYIIEGDFDFFKELNEKNYAIIDTSNDNKCMISHLPLTYNSVTLPCNHSFNYLPLYTELRLHNNNKNITCPYCRELSNKLMPFIPLPTVKKVYGINYPPDKCLPAPECSFILKMGGRKGMKCGRGGITNEEGIFCMKHQHHIKGSSEVEIITAESILNEELWTAAMDQLSKEKSVIELKQMLREKGLKVGGVKKDLVKRLFM